MGLDDVFSTEDPEYWLPGEEEDPSEEYAQQAVATEPHPPDDIGELIRTAREGLINTIVQDKVTHWKDEKGWKEQANYHDYRDKVTKLLSLEKDYMHMFLVEASSRQRPVNLLQHVLEHAAGFYPTHERLHKAKFLLQLITDVDPTQISPKSGPKPLHAAAKFDIKLDKASDPDLTIFTCNLMGDRAAAEICETNQDNENILHLAIRHDLKGVEDFIQRANKAAFRGQRTSKRAGQGVQPDDGNTPLHDALDLKHFLMPGPCCAVPRIPPAMPRTGVATEGETSRSGIASKPEAAAAVARVAQQQANQAKPRANLAGASQLGQTQRSAPSMCPACINAYKKNRAALKRRKSIINLLLQGDLDALSVHNSAGLSPYLYLLAACQKSAKDRSAKEDSPSAGRQEQSPKPGLRRQLTRDGVEMSGIASNNGDMGDRRDTDPYGLERRLRDEKKMVEKQHMQRTESATGLKEGINQARPHGGDARNAGGVREAVRNRVETHTDQELKPTDIGSGEVLNGLKETAFRLGGYKKACDCLFRDQSAHNPTPFDGEDGRRRRFSLVGRQRVQLETTENFNFLVFEPTMASVVLSLEYTQEELQNMPSSDKERLEMWRQDETNLKAVFKWLKVDKGVKAILNLIVKDNPNHYCSDDTVEECLKDLEVRYLDWNRPDLCANSFTLPNTLVEISLYWTGLNAVLWSWSDTEGLRTLIKLQKVYLYVQKGVDIEGEQDKKVEAFKNRVEQWPRQAKPQIKVRIDERQLRGSGKGGGLGANFRFTKHSWIETAAKFGEDLSTHYRERVSQDKPRYHVKVALLDDGVDPTYDRNGTNLHHVGWPSVDSGGPEEGARSFYVSTNQHGSKMAWLIRKVCPFVTIYVAKLDVRSGDDLRRRSFSLQQATEAIKWATAQGVDIISMSWNAREIAGQTGNTEEIRKLEKAIDDAADARILMFGAACDVKESSSSDKWMPCDSTKVWSIGATDVDYDAKKYVHMNKKIDYLFPGEHVLDSHRIEDAEVGNSGATALAAGLAAMVIFCMRIECESLPYNKHQWMANVMTKVFNSERNNNSVRVKDVLQLDKAKKLSPLVQKFVSQKV